MGGRYLLAEPVGEGGMGAARFDLYATRWSHDIDLLADSLPAPPDHWGYGMACGTATENAPPRTGSHIRLRTAVRQQSATVAV